MPQTKGNKRGRPEFQPTAVQRRQVTVAAAGGMSHEEIAIALALSRNTLEKHFEAELSAGAQRRRLAWLESLDKAARGGNVAACKALLATVPVFSVPPAPTPEPVKPPAEEKLVKAPKLGKKEQAKLEAQTAGQGNEWGGLLTPPTSTLPQ